MLVRSAADKLGPMGCLFALIAVLSPRFAVFLLWAFTNYVDRAFNGWVLPLLGLLFAPWTTLLYVLADAPAGPIHVAGWIMVGIGVVLDLSSWAQAAQNRASVPRYSS
jgi:hypothetical protein